MKKPVSCMSLVISYLFLVTCNSPSSSTKSGCGRPTIHGCSGDPCVYAYIYDANGNFVNEISGSFGPLPWNATDCHGNKVGCGKYTVNMHIIYNGQATSQTTFVLVIDSATVSKTGRSACDSLKKNCTGNYYENIADSISDNLIGQDVGCICCQ